MDFKIIKSVVSKPYLAIGATLFLCILLFMPSDNFQEIDIPFTDKGAHFLAFGGVSFLWFMYFKKRWLTLIILMGFGVLTEVIQSLLPTSFHRSSDTKDLLADFIGILLGLITAFLSIKYVFKIR